VNITLLVNNDVESNLVLNALLPELADHRLSVFLSARVGKESPKHARALGQLRFVEQDLFLGLVFEHCSVHPAPAATLASFRGLSLRHRVPFRLLSCWDREAIAEVRATEPDLVLSVRFGYILREEILSVPRFGVLNLHSGILPTYRGVLPTLRALAHGDERIGSTLHFIDGPGIDVGPIVAVATIDVDRSRSLFWHILRVYPPGVRLIIDAVRRLAAGEPLAATPQEASSGSYYTFPTDRELGEFLGTGGRLFDDRDVRDLIRQYLPDFL
jgi:methionyl-tRNA formyltransferase